MSVIGRSYMFPLELFDDALEGSILGFHSGDGLLEVDECRGEGLVGIFEGVKRVQLLAPPVQQGDGFLQLSHFGHSDSAPFEFVFLNS